MLAHEAWKGGSTNGDTRGGAGLGGFAPFGWGLAVGSTEDIRKVLARAKATGEGDLRDRSRRSLAQQPPRDLEPTLFKVLGGRQVGDFPTVMSEPAPA